MADYEYRESFSQRLKAQLVVLAWLVAGLWLLEAVDTFFLSQRLNQYGIHPRRADGLTGILAAPFLHGGFEHLAANTIPLIVLAWLVLLRSVQEFLFVSCVIIVASGLGVWVVGESNSVHIGASSLIFGYFGHLLLLGYFERSLSSIGIALLVAVVYGSMIWGVLPKQADVSWEGHLFGFVGGALSAKMFARQAPGGSTRM